MPHRTRKCRPTPPKKAAAVHQLYNIQTYMDAFSSKDLVNWTKHPKVLTTDAVKWVKYAMWAPAILEHKGKYYLFFSGNDIQNDHEYGGIASPWLTVRAARTRMRWANR